MSNAGIRDNPTFQVAVFGAGFAGIGVAAELKRRGIDDFVILEREAEVGGVWRDNRYPGCRCDVPSTLYSFSFLKEPNWTDRYATQSEIFGYLRGSIRALDLDANLRLGAEVRHAEWDARALLWRVTLTNGSIVSARMIAVATGAMDEPEIPKLDGLDGFQGEVFHTSTWPEGFDPTGKRIAVIGTGASAVQVVPEIAERAEQVTVFQRSAPWVLPRGDRTIPSWARRFYARVPGAMDVSRQAEYLRRELMINSFAKSGPMLQVIERLGRRHIRRQIRDEALRSKVTPKFVPGCKRMLMSDDWYQTLDRDDVELVAGGVTGVSRDGWIETTGDVSRSGPFDTVVLATGFRVQRRTILAKLIGTEGASLATKMAQGRPTAYLGSTFPGFPNMVLMTGPNTGLANNSMIVMIEAQAQYAASMAEFLAEHEDAALAVQQSAFNRFQAEMARRLARSVWESGGCGSWYKDGRGRVTALWPGTTMEFRHRTSSLDLDDYELVPARQGN